MSGKMATANRAEMLTINQKGWNEVASRFYGSTALPHYGPLAQTEEDLHLIDNLEGKAVLELGCGSGHSLCYLAKTKKARELWGVDLSQTQIHLAQEYLNQKNVKAQLLLASMDENVGILEAHFDLVVAIYSLGWTPNLEQTLSLVYAYLKPGGAFIFSWEHPVYKCLTYCEDIDNYVFTRRYLQEGAEIDPSWQGVEIVLYPRTLASYLNAVIASGLVIERVIESEPDINLAREQDYAPSRWYSVPRAQLVPTTLIVKACRPS
jgi:ubiquinone/menaquinone biosynthesis C-methylase UbiE